MKPNTIEKESANLYTPGCGKPTHVHGTNGGMMPCGGILHQFDGTAQYFCAVCDKEISKKIVTPETMINL